MKINDGIEKQHHNPLMTYMARQTDRQKDGQTDGEISIYPPELR